MGGGGEERGGKGRREKGRAGEEGEGSRASPP